MKSFKFHYACDTSIFEKSMSRHILIIEDDESLREIYSIYFEIEGFKVSQAENGQSALDMLQGLHKRDYPDCIVLDLMMPVMDGKSFLKVLNSMVDRELRNIPVIICSAFGEYEPTPQVFQFLYKPLQLDTLLESVNRCLIHRRTDKSSVV